MNNIENEKKKCIALLGNVHKILMINHRRMDGDALGSLSAFYYLLKKIGGYEIVCFNDAPTPEVFHFLTTEELFECEINLDVFSPELIIAFDCAGVEQLGSIYVKYRDIFDTTPFISIDHHASNVGFAQYNIIDPQASSACEVVYDIIQEFSFEKYIDTRIASFLLMGIISDTNSFINSNSTAKSLKTASELMKYHPCHQEIIINLFKKKPFARVKLWGKILEGLKSSENGKIVWNIIPNSVFIQTQTTDKDISGLLDEFIVTIESLEVGFFLYETKTGIVKGSFRGKTERVDLSELCAHFGGGGHPRASGFLQEGKNIYEVEQAILHELKKFF